jgi:hypothetical protein
MLKLSDANNFRRIVVGACMIVAPLLSLASVSTQPEAEGGAGGQLAAIAEHPGSSQLSILLFLFSQLAFLPAVLGIMHLLRDRGVVLGHTGGGLALAGLFGHAVTGGSFLVVLQMVGGGADRGQMIALLERMQESSSFIVFALMGLGGFLLGFIVLAVGLWRARVAPGWVTALIIVSFVLEFIVSNFIDYAGVVAGALFAFGFGWIGLKVLTMPDAEWGASSGLRRDASVQRAAPVR